MRRGETLKALYWIGLLFPLLAEAQGQLCSKPVGSLENREDGAYILVSNEPACTWEYFDSKNERHLAVFQAPPPPRLPAKAFGLAPSGGRLQGFIDASGYHPPSGVVVTWRHGDRTAHRPLNPDEPFSRAAPLSQYRRYGGGDLSLIGAQMLPRVTGETSGGMVGSALLQIFRDRGLNREYTEQELFDCAVANFPGVNQVGCSGYETLVGRPDPTCVDIPNEGGRKLRPQPTEPDGCCRIHAPCSLNEPSRRPGEVWVEPVRTPQGGARGCYLKNTAAAPLPDAPEKPEDPQGPVCDGVCNRASDIVRCPSDCQTENPPESECPMCPAPDSAACEVFVAPLRNQVEVLSSRLQEVEGELLDERARLAARDLELQILRTERDELKAALEFERVKPPLPVELAVMLRDRRAAARGPGQRAAAGRAIRGACSRFTCPEDL